jgi:hypothetical protein
MTPTLADQERAARRFAGLCHELRTEPDRNGECWIDCPWCGKGGKHFSFSINGAHCFACGAGSRSLVVLAEQLKIMPVERAVLAPPPRKPRQWQSSPERWLNGYCEALDRVPAWQQYKPLTLDTIARFRLGVGRLPSSKCAHRRLIVPVPDGGTIAAFHGRAFLPADQDDKWLCAGGSDKGVLFVAGAVRPGCLVVIVENYVDAILAWQCDSAACYVAIGGASIWRPEWTSRIAQARPKGALIWLDHDLAGNGSRYHQREMLIAWRKSMEARRAANPRLAALPFPPDPTPRAPKIANELLAAGVRTTIYEWPKGTSWKQDIGAELMRGMRHADGLREIPG